MLCILCATPPCTLSLDLALVADELHSLMKLADCRTDEHYRDLESDELPGHKLHLVCFPCAVLDTIQEAPLNTVQS